jgi:hypothetical protein
MTAPKITYGHGYVNDFSAAECADFTTATADGQTVTVTPGYLGDYLDINCTVSTGNKTYKLANATPLALLPIVYPCFIYRFKTSGSAKAMITAVYSDASTEILLPETSSISDWQTVKKTITTNKSISYFALSCNGGTGHVYYDFILLCVGQFTFPQFTKLTLELPNRYSQTKIPSKATNKNKWMGADDAQLLITGDVDDQNADWKTLGYGTVAEIFFMLHHRANTETFQWFNCDSAAFKVVVDNAKLMEGVTDTYKYSYEMYLHEYSRANKTNERFQERFGLLGVST